MTKRKRPTSFEVARRAGVARSTVSMVLNEVPGSGIPEATRQRVRTAARELGYVPSAAARTLVSGRARTLGLVVSHGEHLQVDAFVPRALQSLNAVTREAGFRVLLESAVDVSRHDAYSALVRAKQIDGLVVLNPRADDRQLERLVDSGFPVVSIGHLDHPGAVTVHADDARAAAEATRHLLAGGRRRIAHIGYGPPAYGSVRARLDGYRAALAEADVAFDEARVAFADYTPESGAEAAAALLERAPRPPDALFCGNDTIAFGALTALRARGLRVPEDVAVVGCDDIPLARHALPPLTTLRLPAVAMGEAAGRMLLAWIDGAPPPERQLTLAADLVVRASCGMRSGSAPC